VSGASLLPALVVAVGLATSARLIVRIVDKEGRVEWPVSASVRSPFESIRDLSSR
jgi:hypothetical protein